MAKALHHGDVVLVPFPFADLTGQKVRPSVVVSADPQGSELIVAFISTNLANRSARGAEIELLQGDAEFRVTGLKGDSLFRLDKLVTLSRTIIARRLATIGLATRVKLAAGLRQAFGL